MRKPSYLSSNIQSLSSNGPSVSVASIGCRRLGNFEVRATITRSMGGRCNGQGKQPSSRDKLRCYRARVLFELDGASSNTLSELCALRTASHGAKARGRPEHKKLGRA